MSVVPFRRPERQKHGLLDFPIVFAPSPADVGTSINLEISPSTIQKIAAAQRRTPLFEAWGHLVGAMPPVNNAAAYLPRKHPGCEITAISGAHACFQGVKRPYGCEDNGEAVYVYIIKSDYTVRWKPDMACVADIVPVPDDVVLTVQVRDADALQPETAGVWGTITKWEFVRVAPEHPALPFDHAERYTGLLWSR